MKLKYQKMYDLFLNYQALMVIHLKKQKKYIFIITISIISNFELIHLKTFQALHNKNHHDTNHYDPLTLIQKST
jgi:hypothetical protein